MKNEKSKSRSRNCSSCWIRSKKHEKQSLSMASMTSEDSPKLHDCESVVLKRQDGECGEHPKQLVEMTDYPIEELIEALLAMLENCGR